MDMGSKNMLFDRFKRSLKIKLLLDGILVGIVSGFASTLYRYTLSKLDILRGVLYSVDGIKIFGVLILFFIMGVCMAALLKWAPLSGGSGIPQIRGELMSKTDMECGPTLISKFVGGGMGNLAGLSLGREGPSIQIGGTMAKILGKLMKKDPLEMNYMITAGASAGLSAAFNAPLAGALFSLEEMHKSLSHYLMVPCVFASVIANYISFHFLGVEPAFSFTVTENLPLHLFPAVILLGIITGFLGVLFNIGLDKGSDLFEALPIKKYWVLGLLLVLTFPLGRALPDVLGGGHHFVEKISLGEISLKPLIIMLFAKMIFTWISYDSGAQGGIFLPTLVIGGAAGLAVFYILDPIFSMGDYGVNFIILGMVGILTAVVRAPLLAMLLVTEMTGSFSHLIAIAVISMVAFLVAEAMGNLPIYDTLYNRLMRKVPKKEEEPEECEFTLSSYTLTSLSPVIGVSLDELDFPNHLLILSVEREGTEFFPTSKDVLMPGDHVTVFHDLCDKEAVEAYFAAEEE